MTEKILNLLRKYQPYNPTTIYSSYEYESELDLPLHLRMLLHQLYPP